MARLILDTCVLVGAFTSRLNLGGFVEEDDVALPALAVAEYLAGVHLDKDDRRRAGQRRFLDEVLAVVPVEDYTPIVAQHHAVLLAEVTRAGTRAGHTT